VLLSMLVALAQCVVAERSNRPHLQAAAGGAHCLLCVVVGVAMYMSLKGVPHFITDAAADLIFKLLQVGPSWCCCCILCLLLVVHLWLWAGLGAAAHGLHRSCSCFSCALSRSPFLKTSASEVCW
jgi:hypothetical protein